MRWSGQLRWWILRKLNKEMSFVYRDAAIVPYGGFMGVCDLGGFSHRSKSVMMLKLTPSRPNDPRISIRLCPEHAASLAGGLNEQCQKAASA